FNRHSSLSRIKLFQETILFQFLNQRVVDEVIETQLCALRFRNAFQSLLNTFAPHQRHGFPSIAVNIIGLRKNFPVVSFDVEGQSVHREFLVGFKNLDALDVHLQKSFDDGALGAQEFFADDDPLSRIRQRQFAQIDENLKTEFLGLEDLIHVQNSSIDDSRGERYHAFAESAHLRN